MQKEHEMVKNEEDLRREIRQGWHIMKKFDDKLRELPVSFLFDPDSADAQAMRQHFIGAAAAMVSSLNKLIGLFNSISAKRIQASATVCKERDLVTDERIMVQKDGMKLQGESSPEDIQGSTKVEERNALEASECCPSKKRKSSSGPTNSDQENEAHLEDGYSWRKYGQKDIFGSKHPRSYYRCRLRKETGCQAIKYVQKSDDNPPVFKVIYKGKHICHLPGAKISSSHLRMPLLQSSSNSVFLSINNEGNLQLGSCYPKIPAKQEHKIPLSEEKTIIESSSTLSKKDIASKQSDLAWENLEWNDTVYSSISAPILATADMNSNNAWGVIPSWFEESAKFEAAEMDELGVQSSDMQLPLLRCLNSDLFDIGGLY